MIPKNGSKNVGMTVARKIRPAPSEVQPKVVETKIGRVCKTFNCWSVG